MDSHWMRKWPAEERIRAKRRVLLLKARKRRNFLIEERVREKTEGRRIRNLTLTARDDTLANYARASARLYGIAVRQLRGLRP